MEEGYLPPLGSVSSAAVRKEEEVVQGSWDLKYDQMESRFGPKEDISLHVRMAFSLDPLGVSVKRTREWTRGKEVVTLEGIDGEQKFRGEKEMETKNKG